MFMLPLGKSFALIVILTLLIRFILNLNKLYREKISTVMYAFRGVGLGAAVRLNSINQVWKGTGVLDSYRNPSRFE